MSADGVGCCPRPLGSEPNTLGADGTSAPDGEPVPSRSNGGRSAYTMWRLMKPCHMAESRPGVCWWPPAKPTSSLSELTKASGSRSEISSWTGVATNVEGSGLRHGQAPPVGVGRGHRLRAPAQPGEQSRVAQRARERPTQRHSLQQIPSMNQETCASANPLALGKGSFFKNFDCTRQNGCPHPYASLPGALRLPGVRRRRERIRWS